MDLIKPFLVSITIHAYIELCAAVERTCRPSPCVLISSWPHLLAEDVYSFQQVAPGATARHAVRRQSKEGSVGVIRSSSIIGFSAKP
jgi:hypothetical protein